MWWRMNNSECHYPYSSHRCCKRWLRDKLRRLISQQKERTLDTNPTSYIITSEQCIIEGQSLLVKEGHMYSSRLLKAVSAWWRWCVTETTQGMWSPCLFYTKQKNNSEYIGDLTNSWRRWLSDSTLQCFPITQLEKGFVLFCNCCK